MMPCPSSGNSGGEELGLLFEKVRGSETCHGVADDMDAVLVDNGKVLHEILNQGKEFFAGGVVPTSVVGSPGPGGSREQGGAGEKKGYDFRGIWDDSWKKVPRKESV